MTNRQRQELNKSILEYLKASGFTGAYEALKEESGAEDDAKCVGLLEKKWTTVLRLQKKIMTLESKYNQLEQEVGSRDPRAKKGDMLPKAPELHALTGHRNNINCVKFHPDFSLLVSASEDASLRVWDYETGDYERTLKGHTLAVQGVAFDRTGKLMASCSADMTIKLWNFESYTCTKTLHGHDHNVTSVAFLPSGDQIVSSSRDKTIKFWEISTGYCVKTLSGHEEWIRQLIVNEDGTLLATCSQEQTVRVWNVAKGESVCVMREHENVVECIAFSPASLETITEDGAAPSSSGKSGHSGKYLASGSRDKLIKIYEVATGACVMTLEGHENWVRGLRFHPNGKHLLSVGDDRSLRVWDLEQRRCVKTIADAHAHFVSCLDFNDKFPMVATGGVDNAVKVWECR